MNKLVDLLDAFLRQHGMAVATIETQRSVDDPRELNINMRVLSTALVYPLLGREPVERNEGGKTIDELKAAGLTPVKPQDPATFGKPVFIQGRLAGCVGPSPACAVSSSPPPYGAYPPHMYNLYDPTPEKPKPKPGDKRPELTCKKCKNKGKINVSHADGFEVRLMCKLCGKEEVEK